MAAEQAGMLLMVPAAYGLLIDDSILQSVQVDRSRAFSPLSAPLRGVGRSSCRGPTSSALGGNVDIYVAVLALTFFSLQGNGENPRLYSYLLARGLDVRCIAATGCHTVTQSYLCITRPVPCSDNTSGVMRLDAVHDARARTMAIPLQKKNSQKKNQKKPLSS